ncbi:MAG: MFS transporter [Anaerolineae bacterium]|nr:MFS transporter [Anaerolineae bacterium]
MKKLSPWRVLLPAGIGTCLSLLGDASLYTVLPTHTATVGVSIASVGILLSANRFIRLVLNGPVGMAFDRWPRRPLFVSSLIIGAISTAIYGLTQGFWPLLLGRLLWGLAWAGIWVGGNTIVLDITDDDNRGRYVGIYQIFFFVGASGGAMFGGVLTDWLGYHQTMIIGAGITFLGAMIALGFLPETRSLKHHTDDETTKPRRQLSVSADEKAESSAIIGLLSVNRLVMAGILMSTLGIFLLDQFGEHVQIAGRIVGVATLTGIGLGMSTLIAMFAVPIVGSISDRIGNRWRVATGGIVPGVVGFCLMALGMPLSILLGIPLIAFTSGSNQGLSIALSGDLGSVEMQSRRLGVLFTFSDFASAIGPPLAYAVMPILGIKALYLISAGLFAVILLVSFQRARTTALNPIKK